MPQPTSKLHAEWLSLLDISGPFLSMPVLTAAFPQGLDVLEDGQARSLRADYGFWQEKANDPAVHTAWIRLVMESLLGYSTEVMVTGQAISAGWKAEFPEHDETLRPDFMLGDAGDKSKAPHLLIQVYPPGQDLEKTVRGSRWQASAATRMMELLHATEVRLGLLTNGEQWMLVNAPRGETTGFATWYANLWFDEGSTLRAFRSLLGVQRFFGVAEDQTLERLLAASANDQQEITDQLGLQVRHAVEILIQKMDQADQDSNGALLTGIGGAEAAQVPSLLYEAALTVMMRLVFMLSAEERKLLPLDDALYAENYAVSTLYEQLSATEEEVLERRFDAWSRLLAVFRAVHDGIFHERLNLPPYGGSLFDSEKYPFLEGRRMKDEGGRKAEKEIPLPISNRTVLHLLGALQVLQIDGEARRLSFRALDVEQIGHVYEGLLDHNAVRATETMLGLRGAKRHEPEIALSQLEQVSGKKESEFYGWLTDVTGRSLAALKNAMARGIDMEMYPSIRAACGNDEALFARVSRFATLLRPDDFGLPVIILPGSVYVTAGTTRRATGTHYTPRSLTEPVVQHTLEPLVYSGQAEGLPREQWRLRSPQELLDLKICDMAMGSGGFLVQVVRYMAERLVESWGLYGDATVDGRPLTVDSPAEGDVSPATVYRPLSDDDLLTDARRLIAERCIYGVDKNPLAVEIAKLSLWLVTLAKNLPFTFVNHALKCGDSLVGCSQDDFLRWAHGYDDSTMTLFDANVRETLETARAKRSELESFVVRDAHDAERKTALLKEADVAMTHVLRGADLLIGARLLGLKPQEVEGLQNEMLFGYMAGKLDGDISLIPDSFILTDTNTLEQKAQNLSPLGRGVEVRAALRAAQKERAFHWEFAFPEVFEKGGFSAFVGNPPFLGGQRISTMFGDAYFRYLRDAYPSSNGTADLCALFFLRSFFFQKNKGTLGLIATNTIAQGDTRITGLDEIVRNGGTIYLASPSTPWPGIAAVYVSVVHVIKGSFDGAKLIDNKQVDGISSLLDNTDTFENPKVLTHNEIKSFIGSYVLGMGFVLSPDEAISLIKKDSINKDVLFPYLNGEDLNNHPVQSPSRWVINFSDWSLEKAEQYTDCINRVRALVKPEREKQKDKYGRENWWRFMRTRPELHRAIAHLERVLVIARVSKTIAFAFVPVNQVISEQVVVFASSDTWLFSMLQSNLHMAWALKFSSSLKSDLRYSPSDVFETFPFPRDLSGLDGIGEIYHETRREIMLVRQEGLTKTYNRFHGPAEHSQDIVRLRALHVQMDEAVAASYGWGDLSLGHDFHETAQGVRYTISESARREVLSRLLKLNHERYEEEQRAKDEVGSIKDEKKGKKSKGKKVSEESGQYGLF